MNLHPSEVRFRNRIHRNGKSLPVEGMDDEFGDDFRAVTGRMFAIHSLECFPDCNPRAAVISLDLPGPEIPILKPFCFMRIANDPLDLDPIQSQIDQQSEPIATALQIVEQLHELGPDHISRHRLEFNANAIPTDKIGKQAICLFPTTEQSMRL